MEGKKNVMKLLNKNFNFINIKIQADVNEFHGGSLGSVRKLLGVPLNSFRKASKLPKLIHSKDDDDDIPGKLWLTKT